MLFVFVRVILLGQVGLLGCLLVLPPLVVGEGVARLCSSRVFHFSG